MKIKTVLVVMATMLSACGSELKEGNNDSIFIKTPNQGNVVYQAPGSIWELWYVDDQGESFKMAPAYRVVPSEPAWTGDHWVTATLELMVQDNGLYVSIGHNMEVVPNNAPINDSIVIYVEK